MNKDQIVKAIQEAKELVDEVMPLESSVVKDQVLLTLIGVFIQRALSKEMSSVESTVARMTSMTREAMVAAQREFVAAQLTAAAARKGEDWAWDTFRWFMDKLKYLT